MNTPPWKSLWTNPPKEAAGWIRWWWFGCAVEKEEICFELDEMKKAGIGGIEIQILYPLEEENQSNHPIEYCSPEFFNILDFTLTKVEKREMSVDFTLGSGWTYGGSMISGKMGPEILIPYIQEIQDPCNYSFDYTCVLPGELKRAVLIQKQNGILQYETSRDVTEKIASTFPMSLS